MRTVSAASREYVPASVTATVAGSPYSPIADPVDFGFTSIGAAAPTLWYPGLWDAAPNPGTSTYTAQCLVGPGGTVTLAQGEYQVWIRVTDNPEMPVLPVGLLSIT